MGGVMTSDKVARLVDAARSAPSADNSQPWRFVATADEFGCHYCRRSAVDPFGASGHATLLSAGAVHENLARVVATPAGDGVVNRRLDSDSWSIALPLAQFQPAAVPREVEAGISGRHTNRHPFRKDRIFGLASLLPAAGDSLRVVAAHEAILALADSLESCSRARFNDPELHHWLFSSLRWDEAEAASGTGLDMATLHLPPGGRLFMRFMAPWERMRLLNRLGIYRVLAAADTALFRQAPAVLALVGGSGPEEVWETGRIMQRTWIALNQAGVAVHPYYAITDLGIRLAAGRLLPDWTRSVGKALDSAAEVLNLAPRERIHMLFRIGYPTRSPVRSRRLPAATFLAADRPPSPLPAVA